MDVLWMELSRGFGTELQFWQVIIRLSAAVLLGAIIGFEREHAGKAAGLRTHILVTFGTAGFVLTCMMSGFTTEGLSRVIQGVVTGIGFIGAGTIIKNRSARNVKGLTTAAGIWASASIGVMCGLGNVGIAMAATTFTFLILSILPRFEIKPANEEEEK